MTISRRGTVLVCVGVFLVAFVLRAYRPLSRPSQWLSRAESFNQALDERDWANTYQKYHPGVTAMAISGATLRLYAAVSETPAEALMTWVAPPFTTQYGQRMAQGVLGLALALAGLLVATTLTLRKLAGWPLALTAAGLLTFSPFYLSEGRVLHLDALVSSLMLLSALLALVSLESGQRRYWVLSALVGGLALMTKTSSLFLVPFVGLASLAYLVKRLRAGWPEHVEGRVGWVVRETWARLAGPLLLWLLLSLLPFALWPAMWVEPAAVVQEVVASIGFQIETAHKGRFFAGQIYDRKHPPVLFYPAILAFKSSFLTLTLVLAGLGRYVVWPKRGKLPLQPLTFWLLAAYVFFFTVQMTIGAHQDARYILPASVALEVLAAVGLVGVLEMTQQATMGREGWSARALPVWLLSLVVGLQALIALPYAPNYGAHHNHLLGGNRVAVKVIEIVGQNEGITFVTHYLNQLPEAGSLRVGVASPLERSVEQYFSGNIALDMTGEDDYHLFSLINLQRQFNLKRWLGAWEAHTSQGEPPQVTVIIDGVEYMWLYATQPSAGSEPVVVRRGGGLGFIVLAWAWTIGLVATFGWALRQIEKQNGESPRSRQVSGLHPVETADR